MKRYGFSMIELTFVIVILGILAAIAIPRFAATRDDAQIAKGRSDVAAIRAAIVSERQGRLMKGQSAYINRLNVSGVTSTLFDDNDTNPANGSLLQYGIATKDNTDGYWDNSVSGDASGWIYTYRVNDKDTAFTYTPTSGTFTCTPAATNMCAALIN